MGQARPRSGHRLQCLILLFIVFQIISTHSGLVGFKCYVMLWYRRLQTEHRMFTESSVRHERSCSGRTLRIRTMAGTPIIQLCNRLFCSVPPALLLFLLTWVAFLQFLHIVLLSMALYSVHELTCNKMNHLFTLSDECFCLIIVS